MTTPRTRDLRELVDAIAIVEDECRFQADRLRKLVAADTGDGKQETEFLKRMGERYEEATGTLVTLRRYQEGRLDVQQAPKSEYDNTLTSRDVPVAHTQDESQ